MTDIRQENTESGARDFNLPPANPSGKIEHAGSEPYARQEGVTDENQSGAERTENIPPVEAQHADSSPLTSRLSDEKNMQIESGNNQNEILSNFEQKQRQNDIDSASVVQSIGHILRKARAMKNMSIEDVSRQLRLSVQQIEAIENEDFDKLPGRTFLRGFIRNYAHLVQLDPAPLLQMLPESTRVISTYESTPFKNKQLSFSSNRDNTPNHSLIVAIFVFALILGTYFIFGKIEWNKNPDTKTVSDEAKAESKTTSVEIQLPLPAAIKSTAAPQTHQLPELGNSLQSSGNFVTEIESDSKTGTGAVENKPIAEEPEKTAVMNKTGHLDFKFTADSWIRVTDGSGAPIFEQLKKAGSEQVITGKRPLSIVIGNAAGVKLTYNEKEVDISSHKRQDGTARFTLE